MDINYFQKIKDIAEKEIGNQTDAAHVIFFKNFLDRLSEEVNGKL